MSTKSQSYRGLTSQEVEQSRNINGSNILTPPPKTPLWRLYIEKFKDPIIRILIFAALLSLLMSVKTGELVETLGILFAIFLATGISFWFEADAGKKFDLLNKVNDTVAVKVIRDGAVISIEKREVVKGDVIVLDTGDEIPADGEILESVNLTVNESALTGEPQTRKGTLGSYRMGEHTYPVNMLYRGTSVLEGNAVYSVTAVGDSTEYGKVARKSAEMTDQKTPLNRQLEGLAGVIGKVGFVIAVLTFLVLFVKDIFLGSVKYNFSQLWTLMSVMITLFVFLTVVWLPLVWERAAGSAYLSWKSTTLASLFTALLLSGAGYAAGVRIFEMSSWIDATHALSLFRYFMVSVTLIVVAVPEGLPMAVTLSLALSMRKMLLTNNLVRKMHATETMGATTVICTDKTGTLTMNRMMVAEHTFAETDNLIYESIALNTTAHLQLKEEGEIKSLGNPTEAALLLWMSQNGFDYTKFRLESNVDARLSFSTERKYMATCAFSNQLNKQVIYLKGAPEIVALLCNNYIEETTQTLSNYQAKAMRTLGFAFKVTDMVCSEENIEEIVKEGGFSFLGVVAIEDPLREDAGSAVEMCRSAGIKVKMITGDTPGTAREIALRLGILTDEQKISGVISGVEFASLSDEEVLSRCESINVMCRARPSDKERFVKLLQRNGEVVAVTGDGTNDAPALNHANVGLSMGSGTAVAKEASDITLLDDSFGSIVNAVLWGRSLYINIQRFLIFQLTINVTALSVVLLGSIFGKEIPLTITQMLWVNLIMDTFAAGALASLPPNRSVLKDKPRRSDAFIVTKSMMYAIFGTAISFVFIMMAFLGVLESRGGDLSSYDLSVFFTVFVIMQFWNLFNAKAFLTGKSALANLVGSRAFMMVALIIVLGQILIVEFGGEFFRTVPISFKDWIKILIYTSPVLIVGELIRFLWYKLNKNR